MVFDRTHILHYSIIFGVLFVGIVSIGVFPVDRSVQLLIGSTLALFYFCYSVLHHYLEHDLTIKIMVEYALVALLVIALFFFIKGGL